MSNTAAICTSFKVEMLNGIHALGTTVTRAGTTADTFFAALYLATGSLGAGTTAYSATSEVSGTGYSAGGTSFTWSAPTSSGTTSYSTPSANITWSTITLSTAFDTVLLYNSTQSNKAVCVLTFGSQTITAGNLTLTMPTNDSTHAVLQFA